MGLIVMPGAYIMVDIGGITQLLRYNNYIMNIKKLTNTLLTAGMLYEKNSREYRRLILLNILLYVTMFMSSSFAVFNILVQNDFVVAGMDALVCSSLVYASYDVHKNKRLQRAIYIFIGILFVFLLALSLVNQNNSYSLIWTIFFPLVTLLLMDKKKGLLVVNVFYIILFYFAYEGIGIWQSTHWDLASFLRFVGASTTLTYVVYFMEYSHELSEDQLALTRKSEAENMKILHECSIKDALTKLYNRRHLHAVFDKEFKTAQRHDYSFGFFILDIDFFKQYNDLYGHQKGDEALCKLADVLQTHMRRSEDIVFRLGGEEFCGICIDSDASKIQAQLKVLVHAIESLEIEHKGSSVANVLTISMGVKQIESYEDYDFDRLYKEADEALYRAKEEGRNKIVFA